MYALVDCNNFFASCEELFFPKLKNKPVVVLSNNDGCVVARSKAAKKLGIPMVARCFEWLPFFKRHHVQMFSSNFTLYADISRRVMETIESLNLTLEPYSIDETFVKVPHIEAAREIKKRVRKWTGIPVSIGIAPSKTLAKLSNKIAKSGSGIWQYHPKDLKTFPIEDVWGIGRKHGRKLKSYGIYTAYDLVRCEDPWIRKKLTIQGLKMVYELRGMPCFDEEIYPPPKKGIVSSRSFSRGIESFDLLCEALMNFVAKATRKLRLDHSKAGFLQVFISTSRFDPSSYYSNQAAQTIPIPTNFNPTLMHVAKTCLKKIYRPGKSYKRAGVLLSNILSENVYPLDLFTKETDGKRRNISMQTLDMLNRRYQKEILFYAGQGVRKSWQGPVGKRSPCYTTKFSDLLVVS